MGDHEAQVEKVKSGIVTQQESNASAWAALPLTKHIEDHVAELKARRVHPNTSAMREFYLTDLFDGCGFKRVADLSRSKAESWLLSKSVDGMSARTFNAYVAACSAFGVWLLRKGRVTTSVFAAMHKQNEAADPRRQRRTLSRDEIARLIEASRHRPLNDRLHGNHGGTAKLKPETVAELRFRGETNALAYWLMATTGLRFGEVRSLRCADVIFTEQPHIILRAADEKARRGAQIALRADLAAKLK
jgi:integrase